MSHPHRLRYLPEVEPLQFATSRARQRKPGSSRSAFTRPARHENFRPKVLVADAPRELRWRTRLLMPGVFEGEHRFLLEPLPNGHGRFEQREKFRGLLTPLMRDRIDRNFFRGFREMNAALKGRVERGCT